jgi:hypothetical protein
MSSPLLHLSPGAGGPLSASYRLRGTFVEVWEYDRAGTLLYHNAWFTDLEVTSDHVAAIMDIGRSRWKIENEHFNVHKKQGYELEHNYGHGKQTLSMVFYLLNLLAFIAPSRNFPTPNVPGALPEAEPARCFRICGWISRRVLQG